MDILEISGWLVGLISLGYAIYTQYVSRTEGLKYTHRIDTLNGKIETLSHDKAVFARSIHDVCFQSLLRMKNYPHDQTGFMLQRESMIATLQSVQRMAQGYFDRGALVGEFTHGSELSALEQSADVRRIVLISRDLRPDIEEPELISLIRANVQAGKVYVYIVLDIVPGDIIDDFLAAVQPGADAGPSAGSVRVIAVAFERYMQLFLGGTIALYELNADPMARTDVSTLLLFEEVIIPNERRGAVWRRQEDTRANFMRTQVQQICSDNPPRSRAA